MRELDPIRRLAPPATPLTPDELARIRARALNRPPRRLPLLAPVAVAAAVVALVVVLNAGDADREVQAPVGAAHAAEDGVPPLAPESGWTVTRVFDWEAGRGEMGLLRDGRTLLVSWLPTSEAGPAVDPGQAPGARPELRFGTAETDAAVWPAARGGGLTAVWSVGDTTFHAEGPNHNATELAGLVQSLRAAGVDAWPGITPAPDVRPGELADALEDMALGLPLPPSFDIDRLRAETTTRDRYQLRAHVAGAVACGWIAEWVAGKAAGDEARVRFAVEALGTARTWPVLRDMDAQGDYPEVVWQYADAVAGDGTVVGGKTLTVEESYQAALCP